MPFSIEPVRFEHQGVAVTFYTQPDCSISRFLTEQRTFYEAPFLATLAELLPAEGDVIDVGAHIGNHTVYFARVLGRRVLAVEPNPGSRKRLVRNVEANGIRDRVVVESTAAGSEVGSGSMAPQAAGDVGTMSLVSATDDPAVTVEVRPLDETVQDIDGLGRIALVKIDVEGFEHQVLAGAQKLIAEHRPLITTEVQSIANYRSLREAFEAWGYEPVGVANPTPTVVWSPRQFARHHRCRRVLWGQSIEYAVGAALRANRAVLAMRRLEATTPARPEPKPITGDVPVVVLGGEGVDQLATGLEGRFGAVLAVRVTEDADGHHVTFTLRQQDPDDEAGFVADAPASVDREEKSVGRSRAAAERLVLECAARTGAQVVLVAYAFDLVPLARRVVATLEAPYVVLFPSEDVRTSWPAWPFINGARLRLLPPSVDARAWRSRLIMDAHSLRPGETGAGLADRLEQVMTTSSAAERVLPSHRHEHRRVLLVSYYGPPCSAVAIQRVGYWHEALPELAAERGEELEVDVVTASEAVENDGCYHVVADRELDHPAGIEAEALRRRLDTEHVNYIGATWAPYVRRWLRDRRPYDAVVITGNPFFYFELGEEFQRLGTRVVLDFRDPFADNPRFTYRGSQQKLLLELEAAYVEAADAVVSVNDTCLDLVTRAERPQQRLSIANGYDERVVDRVAPDDSDRDNRITFVYAGSFYRDRDPTSFASRLDAERHAFLHMGRSGFEAEVLAGSPAARQLGLRDYRSMMATLKAADAGVIFTSGDPFEQTTKVFDYIGADVEIVIVTAGEPRTGEIHRVTEGLDGVHWVRNDLDEIAAFLAEYIPTPVQRPEREWYSRRGQAGRLLDLLTTLKAPAEQTP